MVVLDIQELQKMKIAVSVCLCECLLVCLPAVCRSVSLARSRAHARARSLSLCMCVMVFICPSVCTVDTKRNHMFSASCCDRKLMRIENLSSKKNTSQECVGLALCAARHQGCKHARSHGNEPHAPALHPAPAQANTHHEHTHEFPCLSEHMCSATANC